jgi:peptidoglycan hydrolase CwlO-like protein
MTAEPAGQPKPHRPIGWIVACVIFALIAIGGVVRAISAQNDADDAQAKLDAQTQQTAQLQSKLDQIQKDVSDAIANAGDDANAAKEQLQSMGDELSSTIDNLKDKVGLLSSSDGG